LYSIVNFPFFILAFHINDYLLLLISLNINYQQKICTFEKMNQHGRILSTLKEKINKIDPDARIILFGSRARHDSHEDSDWDFLILTKRNVTRDLRNSISDTMFEIELETDQVLAAIIQNYDVWKSYSGLPIVDNISNEGIEI